MKKPDDIEALDKKIKDIDLSNNYLIALIKQLDEILNDIIIQQ